MGKFFAWGAVSSLRHSKGAVQSQVNVLNAQRRRETQDNDALEQLGSGFMFAASENDEVVVESDVEETIRMTTCHGREWVE
jgi:hypothetical protein